MKKMGIILIAFLVLMFSSLALSTSALAQWSGSISADNQIDGTGWWGNTAYGNTSLSWNITTDGSSVTYTYEFTHPEHDASYFIIEASDNFGASDIQTGLTKEIGTYSDTGNNYQGMPGSLFGIKFESFTSSVTNPDGTITDTITFESTRLPTWGDFYARCGHHPDSPGGHGTWDAAWNVGFTSGEIGSNSDNDMNDGYHVMVPDTVVPEPVSSTLFIIGSGLFAGRSYLRRKK